MDDSTIDTDTDTDTDTDADSDSGCTTDVEGVCDTIFDICPSLFGWSTLMECCDHFIGDSGYGTECADEAGYFSCVCNCMDASTCDDFSSCEGTCWSAACE